MKLAYREFGEGQPFIILHGLFGQSDNWNTLARQFAEQGFRVLTPDLRNHGLSPHSEEWNYEVMADDLNEFITDHQLRQPVIMGHSMGGKVTLFFEAKYPGTAEKIIIADIAPRAYEPHHDDVLQALNSVDFSIIKTRKEAEAKLGEYIKDFGTRQFLLKNIYWKDSANNIMDWRFNLEVISANYDNIGVEAPLFRSDVPCLVIRGGKSEYIKEQDLKDFEARFPAYTLETVKDAGHWVHAEKPKEFFEAVLQFVKPG
jgi:esterase